VGTAQICLVCAADTISENLRLAAENHERVDLLELRVDHLGGKEIAAAARFPRRVDRPVILTVRRTTDGGKFAGPERERVALIQRLAAAAAGTPPAGGGFAFVDLEEDLDAPDLAERVTGVGARIIRSLHDFSGVPPGFTRRVAALARGPREIPKAAVMPAGAADLSRLLEACSALPGERIILGMGDFGLPTRLLASRLGSYLCYASPSGAPVAPGQVDPVTLEDLYRFRAIGPSTAVFGVIGNPVLHSRSPHIHNRGFAAVGADAVYLPFLADSVGDFLKVADQLGIRGLSVTVPFKQEVIPLLSKSDELVHRTGACNTMTRAGEDGPWAGTNTDVHGFLAPLRSLFGGTVPPGLAATVIGAGGAARAVVHALLGQRVRVLVLNRSPARASEMARSFPIASAGLDEAGFQQAKEFGDLIVQTTSAGMAPQGEVDPAPGLAFRAGQIAYDLVYAPDMTVFLRRARDAGCRVVRGRQMLVAQAMEQFRLFSGIEYPEALREALEGEID
jgi:3-dehydroquinate dehydratase / shikimate dehydrogenase